MPLPEVFVRPRQHSEEGLLYPRTASSQELKDTLKVVRVVRDKEGAKRVYPYVLRYLGIHGASLQWYNVAVNAKINPWNVGRDGREQQKKILRD